MLSEFDIIRDLFNQPGLGAVANEHVLKGIGDDCALLSIPEGKELAMSMDTLVEKIHFPENAPADLLGWRALAVNLSDLAAMGAVPLGFTMSLAMLGADKKWLETFAAGLKSCAQTYDCPLLGGDTTRGPLAITVQAHGLVESGKALLRSNAQVGDRIYVSGSLGNAALAARHLADRDKWKSGSIFESSFYKPVPRLGLGSGAIGIANAAIDISDGLLADLGHICRASGTGAEIHLKKIPLGKSLDVGLDRSEALAIAVTGGDDYELVLTVPEGKAASLESMAKDIKIPLVCIGEITRVKGVSCYDANGAALTFQTAGYQHFDA